MRGLFARIFVSFWLAMLLVLIGTFFVLQLSGPPEHWQQRRVLTDAGIRFEGERALATLEGEGRNASDEQLRLFEAQSGIAAVLLRDETVIAGRQWAGLDLPSTLQLLQAEGARETGRSEVEQAGHRLTLIELSSGSFLTRHTTPSAFGRFIGMHIGPRLWVMGLVAGLLALLLARYLTRPLARLRHAAQRLADGDLSVRVGPQVLGSTREFEALGEDLDSMAERISELLEAQQRLLRDVSHELRSPLARLHVALGLARRFPEAPQHLDRIELEAERLGDLVGQILTMSRLTEALSAFTPVDLGELLSEIVRDAGYEAKDLGRTVELEGEEEVVILGNRDVLRWAVENVLRNAIRFAPEGTAVQVSLEQKDGVVVRIRDRGPGVPEAELEAIFRPFYRVGTDRDRKTGGRGIGLAIAERGVRAHGGTIKARNTKPGLEVTLSFVEGADGLVEPTRGV